MKITMGLIVFDAIRFLPRDMLVKCLTNMYPHMHEIIVVEGAVLARTGHFDGDTTSWTKNGKCTDSTIKTIREFPDPEKKIKLIESNGFWDGKPDQMNQYVKRATGDYIWYVDADEFYKTEDIIKIKEMLTQLKPDCVMFYAQHFWGDFKNVVPPEETRWGNDIPWQRIHRNERGAKWQRVEPPEYILGDGKRADQGAVITRDMTRTAGIFLYHYGYVCWQQSEFKAKFFRNPAKKVLWEAWQHNHNISIVNGAKTVPFTGTHPEIIKDYL